MKDSLAIEKNAFLAHLHWIRKHNLCSHHDSIVSRTTILFIPARKHNFKRFGKDRKARAVVQAWWVVPFLDFAVPYFAEIVLFGVQFTSGVKLNCFMIVAKKRKSSALARFSPRHCLLPVGSNQRHKDHIYLKRSSHL